MNSSSGQEKSKQKSELEMRRLADRNQNENKPCFKKKKIKKQKKSVHSGMANSQPPDLGNRS